MSETFYSMAKESVRAFCPACGARHEGQMTDAWLSDSLVGRADRSMVVSYESTATNGG